MVFQNNVLAGGAGGSGTTTYAIDQSIRFNDNDSAYLKKDYGSDGSQTTFTLSGWFKLGILTGTAHCLFATGFINGSAADFTLYFSGNQLKFFGGYNGGLPTNRLETTQLFRDHSAWYHIVFVADTTNAVSSERLRLYVNGSRVTAFDTETYPSQNNTLVWGDATYSHVIGATGDDQASGPTQTPRFHYDGYMAELVYIDGTALDPSSFGEYNSSNIWVPKDVSGLTFGTNGFHIKGEDSADLGNDSSGNNNDFTTSGLASHDQMVGESPTNNFAIANPLDSSYYMGSETFSEGNLQMTLGSSVGGLATMGITSGKWYAEFEVHSDASGTTYFIIGIYGDQPTSTQHFVGYTSNSYGYYALNGNSYTNFTSSSYGNSYTVGDVVGVAVDLDNNKLYFSKNGTFQNSGDPTSGATGTGAISINSVSSTGLGAYFIASSSASSTPSGHTINYNFGQDGTFAGNVTAGGNSDSNGIGNFKYSVPSGYLALCTKNLGS